MSTLTSPSAVVEEVNGSQPSAAALRDWGALRQAVGRALDGQGGAVATLPPQALPVLDAEATDSDDSAPR